MAKDGTERDAADVIAFRHTPLCLAPLRAPARLGGQKVRCPACHSMATVPLSSDQREAERLSRAAQIDEAVQQHDAALQAERIVADARAEAQRLRSAAALPAAPAQHSPLAWGFGVGCGWIIAGLMASVAIVLVFGGACVAAVGSLFG